MPAEQITDEQLSWEYINYEIRKFSIRFSKEKGKKKIKKIKKIKNTYRAETVTIANELKELG